MRGLRSAESSCVIFMSDNSRKHDAKASDPLVATASGKMRIEVEPNELSFEYPSRDRSRAKLYIYNINNYYTTFKIKTTTPKQYSVRPTSGMISPNSSCSISISLAAAPEAAPSAPDKCTDKFLVVCKRIPDRSPPTSGQEMVDFISKFWTHGGHGTGLGDNDSRYTFEKRIKSDITLKGDKSDQTLKRRITRIPMDSHDSNLGSMDQELSAQASDGAQKGAFSHKSSKGAQKRVKDVIIDEDDGSSDDAVVDQAYKKSTTARKRSISHSRSLHPSAKVGLSTSDQSPAFLSGTGLHSPEQTGKSLSISDLFYPPLVYWIVCLSVFV